MRHIENVEKSLTSECFSYCFNKKKLIIDFNCVSICYHKYLFAINEIKKIVEEEGRLFHSDYVAESMGEVKRDRFKDEIFPIGGHPLTMDGAPLKRKFFESYRYSDPFKNGR